MYPPVFEAVANDASVREILGENPVRVFPFGSAPPNVKYPYAVWQTITGSPINHLDLPPDTDRYSVQIDVYSKDVQNCRMAAKALRNAIEFKYDITAFNGESRDFQTNNYRYSFTCEFFTKRT